MFILQRHSSWGNKGDHPNASNLHQLPAHLPALHIADDINHTSWQHDGHSDRRDPDILRLSHRNPNSISHADAAILQASLDATAEKIHRPRARSHPAAAYRCWLCVWDSGSMRCDVGGNEKTDGRRTAWANIDRSRCPDIRLLAGDAVFPAKHHGWSILWRVDWVHKERGASKNEAGGTSSAICSGWIGSLVSMCRRSAREQSDKAWRRRKRMVGRSKLQQNTPWSLLLVTRSLRAGGIDQLCFLGEEICQQETDQYCQIRQRQLGYVIDRSMNFDEFALVSLSMLYRL